MKICNERNTWGLMTGANNTHNKYSTALWIMPCSFCSQLLSCCDGDFFSEMTRSETLHDKMLQEKYNILFSIPCFRTGGKLLVYPLICSQCWYLCETWRQILSYSIRVWKLPSHMLQNELLFHFLWKDLFITCLCENKFLLTNISQTFTLSDAI